MWGASMIEALKEYDPHTSLTAPDFRDFLITGFPWHHPEKPYTHIKTSEEWWEPIIEKFARGYMHYGISEVDSFKLAVNTRRKFTDLNRWSLFDDTLITLTKLKQLGWKHTIVSNHIPELENIVASLGLMNMIDHFINSALVGYEKPNPEIYRIAFETSGRPEEVWMIGDNIEADGFGAEAVGIKSILVRNIDTRAQINCKNLIEVISIVESRSEEGINIS
jgi:putative hydrolase of the HAD superfamily